MCVKIGPFCDDSGHNTELDDARWCSEHNFDLLFPEQTMYCLCRCFAVKLKYVTVGCRAAGVGGLLTILAFIV